MNRLPDTPVCERGHDLISFLYGEIDERAAGDFEQHLMNCAECESAIGAFKHVRSAVVAWRQESLGGATNSVSVSTAVERAPDLGKPSAIAAVRQFFDLSPLWLKGSIAFASVLFCLLSVLALAHLFENPQPVVAEEEKRYSDKELNRKIEEALKSRLPGETQKPTSQPATAVNNNQRDKPQRRATKPSSERLATNPKIRRGPLTKSEREQLAADLRLIVPQDDTDLELLGDGNNQ
ncbi:MAG: zf-HC2 domain-containing protein [Pyrinomonadaceae bacterium]|nr:zf-HC2 domain-containing protein [Pyrinomonadaceae bacterium]